MDFKREFSTGGVVYKKFKGLKVSGFKFLLGKHSGYHKWVLPKGLIEPGEKEWQTALRETEEEVGVKAKLVNEKPIHKETYFYFADLKNLKSQNANLNPFDKLRVDAERSRSIKTKSQNSKLNKSSRRVTKYQEEGGEKIKVFKTVTFYLMEYTSGDPKKHGWEMEEAGWFGYDEALKLMAFEGEKEALKKANKLLIANS